MRAKNSMTLMAHAMKKYLRKRFIPTVLAALRYMRIERLLGTLDVFTKYSFRTSPKFSALLNLGFGLQLHLSVLYFNGVFHAVAAVLLADLRGFFLDEGAEALEIAGDRLSSLLLGFR